MMSKYQRTEFSNEDLSTSNFLEQNNVLFSKQAFDKDKRRRSSGSSLKAKLNSNLVDKLAMDKNGGSVLSKATLNKKSNLIGLNSITNSNPIHGELNEPLTEIELDTEESSPANTVHLDRLARNHKNGANPNRSQQPRLAYAHPSALNVNSSSQQPLSAGATNPHELSNMKRMLVSLETNLENGSNLNRSYLYSTNTLTEPSAGEPTDNGQSTAGGDNQPRLLGLMNAVHLNHSSSNFQTTPNVSFFGLQSSTIDPSGNVLFGNIGKFKNNARFGSFFRKIKFIWHRATLLERLFGIFIFLLLITICYLSFTVLSLQTLNKNLEQAAVKRKHRFLAHT